MSRPVKYWPLTPDQTARLCSACRTPREKRVVWVLLDTGLRLGELAALSAGDLDVPHGCLYAGTPPDRRAVKLTPRSGPLLASWFEEHASLGLCARSIQRILKKIGMRAGLPGVGAEVLRQTFAVYAAANGTSPLELRRLLGFKHISAVEAFFEPAHRQVRSQ